MKTATLTFVSGHKTAECKGKWIDVGTLHEPGRQLCDKCRGVRMKPLLDEEAGNVDRQVEELADILKIAAQRRTTGLTALRQDLQELDPVVFDEDTKEWWYFDSEPPYQFGPFASEDEARKGMRQHLNIGTDKRPAASYDRGMQVLAYVILSAAIGASVALLMVIGNIT